MRVVDLFAGCGGLSKGFQNAGYDVVAAFDNWAAAANVYRKNFAHPVHTYDLRHVTDVVPLLTKYAPHIIIGGPPCQDFSSAGKRDETLGRADLTLTFAKIVTTIRPVWFVMENVERAATSHAFVHARAIFHAAGYGLTQTVLDASLCGVPQIRKRVFLIGQLGGQHDSILPYLNQGLAQQPLTVKQYFQGIGYIHNSNHYYRHPRSYARRGVFSIDEPSPTIRGVNRPIPRTYRTHPGDTAPVSPELRPLTTYERALIQTFPPDFALEGTKADIEQMIGNAVPVNLAAYVAQAIHSFCGKTKAMPEPYTVEARQLVLF